MSKKNPLHIANVIAKSVMSVAALAAYLGVGAAVQWPGSPLGSTTTEPPLTMLTVGRDHTLFFEAYNDASDINEDGQLDIGFNEKINYVGLFDPHLCYTYSSDQFNISKYTADGTCSGEWSGKWLNYITTSRIDALRVVLYGGYRKTDSASETILERAYIPQDGHSWAKEYINQTTSGYDITEYTPLEAGSYFFGNFTDAKVSNSQGTDCSTLSNCSDKNPLLRIVKNPPSGKRVWDWASAGRYYSNPGQNTMLFKGSYTGDGGSGTWSISESSVTDRVVRVEACKKVGDYISPNCKGYPADNPTHFKPTGLLHEYADSMKFGLLTGSYNKPMAGGVLRKVVSSFNDEVNAATGQFTDSATIVKTLNNLRIRDFNNGLQSNHYRRGNSTDIVKPAHELDMADWGNPIGEMMYEVLRYFAGKGSATSDYNTSGSHDAAVGLSRATWDDPYASANVAWCARPNSLVLSTVNVSYDSDQLPGSSFGSFTDGLGGGQRPALNVSTLANQITGEEALSGNHYFLGQTNGSNYDAAPTPKPLTNLATVRGLTEEPTKRGSYYSASVAYYGKTNDLRPDLDRENKSANPVSVDTYVVALSSPLPKIEVPFTNNRKITLVPFGKSYGQHAGGGNADISRNKGAEQPTATIVDFYVDTIANSNDDNKDSSINGGRYYAKFRVNFEDVEQGNDYDMDVIVEYTVELQSNGTLKVTVSRLADASGPLMSLGYVISGTTADGTYLVIGNEKTQGNTNNGNAYYLNVPPNRKPGYCDVTSKPSDCRSLPASNSRTFKPSNAGSASILKDPLWYAAKYGGFVDRDGNKRPNLTAEWDSNGDGVPDNYFMVQNPTKLAESLRGALERIMERNGSSGNIIANSTALSTESLVYQGSYNSSKWSGELTAYPVTNDGVSNIPQWKASEKIPAPADRKIYYGGLTGSTLTGKEFKWSTFSPTEQNDWFGTEHVLNFLRGDRSKEVLNGGTLRDRATSNVLGDIAHSSPFYVDESKTVFIGANDGMLHAFSANDGKEVFAYIPREVLVPDDASEKSRLVKLTQLSYGHEYFVDGDIAVTNYAQTPAKNYLVASLGRGGKGLFGLDVTNPGSFGASSVKWEYTPKANSTAAADPNLGYMLGRPVLGRLKDGTMAVFIGNGYNSTDGKPALYVFNVIDGTLIKKLVADTSAADNGLAAPGLRVNDSGVVEYAYAGDLHGNVWKFDLNSTSPTDWSVGSEPMFVAKNDNNERQPITAPMKAVKNPATNDWFVHFGTGSDFRVTDSSDDSIQSWYGLIDSGSVITRADLRKGGFENNGEEKVVSDVTTRAFTEASESEMTGKKGWYIDLPAAERIVTASNYYKLAEDVLIASSIIPLEDPCLPGGKGFLNAVNPWTGGRLSKPLFDLNNDGKFNGDDAYDGSTFPGSVDPGVGKPGEAVLVGDRLVVGGSDSKVRDFKVNTGASGATFKGRISWREIVLQ